MKKRVNGVIKALLLSIVVSVVFMGCSLSGDSTVSGTASKGPIASATVSVYVLNSDGTRGSLLGSIKTDADGNYSLNVSYTGPVAVVVTGGSYSDEATGATVTLGTGDELVTFLDSAANGKNVAVTALTTIAAKRAAAEAANGLQTAIQAANSAVAIAFGMGSVDISSVLPADPTKTASAAAAAASQVYGIIMAALTQMAVDKAASAADVLTLIQELAADFSDGTFDGYDSNGTIINFAFGTPLDFTTDLSTAITNFLKNTRNQTGLAALPAL